VKVRILTALTAATVWAGASAQEPPKLNLKAPAPTKTESGDMVMNQSLADQIAKKLDGHPAMTGSDVQIFTSSGVVTLVGTVQGDRQKTAILDVVRYVPNVKQVRDGIKLVPVKQTQGVGGQSSGAELHRLGVRQTETAMLSKRLRKGQFLPSPGQAAQSGGSGTFMISRMTTVA